MGSWVEAGDRTYARRYEPWDVTVGVVIGERGVLVIDTRADAAQGTELVDDLRELDRRPAAWVVNTHDHFDHVGGNGQFPGAELFTAPAAVDLGDRTVVLRRLGAAHTVNDVIVVVPDTGVVFAGDLVEESGPPAYGEDSFPLDWPVANARLLGLIGEADRVVPGHGAVIDRRFVAEQLAGLVTVADLVRSLWVGEVPVERALEEGGDRWPWPRHVLRDAVARGYAALDLSAERGTSG